MGEDGPVCSVLTPIGGTPTAAVLDWEIESSTPEETVHLGVGSYPGAGFEARIRAVVPAVGSPTVQHTVTATSAAATVERIDVRIPGAAAIHDGSQVIASDTTRVLDRPIDWQARTLRDEMPADWTSDQPETYYFRMTPEMRQQIEELQTDTRGVSLTHELCYATSGEPQWPTVTPDLSGLIPYDLATMAPDCGPEIESLISAWWYEYRVPMLHEHCTAMDAHPLLDHTTVQERWYIFDGLPRPGWYRWSRMGYAFTEALIHAWVRTGDDQYRAWAAGCIRAWCDQQVHEVATSQPLGSLRMSGWVWFPSLWDRAAAPYTSGMGTMSDHTLLVWWLMTGDRRVRDILEMRVTKMTHVLDFAESADPAHGDTWLQYVTYAEPHEVADTLWTLGRFDSAVRDRFQSTAVEIAERMVDLEQPYAESEEAWSVLASLGGWSYLTGTYKTGSRTALMMRLTEWSGVPLLRTAALQAAAYWRDNLSLQPLDYMSWAGVWLAWHWRQTGDPASLAKMQYLVDQAAVLSSEYAALPGDQRGLQRFSVYGRPDGSNGGFPHLLGFEPGSHRAPDALIGLPSAVAALEAS